MAVTDSYSSEAEYTLYPHKADTLTTRNIVDAYRSAYYSVHGQYPGECRFLKGRWFVIEGVERDRGWVVLEVERLRQEAIAKAIRDETPSSRRSILRVIRRLSRI
jgi:hypothetical protein